MELVELSAAGSVEPEEVNVHLERVANQFPSILIPVISVGEARLPWKAKIWSPPIAKLI